MSDEFSGFLLPLVEALDVGVQRVQLPQLGQEDAVLRGDGLVLHGGVCLFHHGGDEFGALTSDHGRTESQKHAQTCHGDA